MFLNRISVLLGMVIAIAISDAYARTDCDINPRAPICNPGCDADSNDCHSPTIPSNSITEGKLYRESSTPEVYVIHDGKKIWIPTPYALFDMGYNWSQVTVVPDGSLNNFPRFNIPSSSPTPGSFVFPPDRTGHYPLKLAGVQNQTKVVSQGKEIQITELYGWLRGVEGCNESEGDGADIHYHLELDTEWAISQGIDLNRILRVGNFFQIGVQQPTTWQDPGPVARQSVSLPLINIELNSWGWRSRYPFGNQKPQDWTHSLMSCRKPVFWPFEPYRPDPLKPEFEVREDYNRVAYVRISGSLITDAPHDVQHRAGTFFCRNFRIACDQENFEWEGSVPDWSPGMDSNNPEHYARWTEIHPPDLIERLNWKEPQVTVRGVALAARTGIFEGTCQRVEFDVSPEAIRPPNSIIAYEELRGPECYFPTGENSANGSWITSFDDHIHVRARVCGGGLFGSPGRFKAIYRTWWKPAPLPSSPLPIPIPPRQGCITACNTQRDACMANITSPDNKSPQQCVTELTRCKAECFQ